jgi:hypothetical protein
MALGDARRGIEDLREIAAGIHPRPLPRGLAAIDALTARLPIPVQLEVPEQAPGADRGKRLLLLLRGAHQCGQARPRHVRVGAAGTRGRPVRCRGKRRDRRRRAPVGNERAQRPARPHRRTQRNNGHRGPAMGGTVLRPASRSAPSYGQPRRISCPRMTAGCAGGLARQR